MITVRCHDLERRGKRRTVSEARTASYSQVQWRQPWVVQIPQVSSKLSLRACRARWSRTVRLFCEMFSSSATR